MPTWRRNTRNKEGLFCSLCLWLINLCPQNHDPTLSLSPGWLVPLKVRPHARWSKHTLLYTSAPPPCEAAVGMPIFHTQETEVLRCSSTKPTRPTRSECKSCRLHVSSSPLTCSGLCRTLATSQGGSTTYTSQQPYDYPTHWALLPPRSFCPVSPGLHKADTLAEDGSLERLKCRPWRSRTRTQLRALWFLLVGGIVWLSRTITGETLFSWRADPNSTA